MGVSRGTITPLRHGEVRLCLFSPAVYSLRTELGAILGKKYLELLKDDDDDDLEIDNSVCRSSLFSVQGGGDAILMLSKEQDPSIIHRKEGR